MKFDTYSLVGEDWWNLNANSQRVYYYKLDGQKLEETRRILQHHLEIKPDTSNLNDGIPANDDGTGTGADGNEEGQNQYNSDDQSQYDSNDQNPYDNNGEQNQGQPNEQSQYNGQGQYDNQGTSSDSSSGY
ncbi:hypothetical protein P5G51_004375 [Virgibacillus sp. 179-BFC.A HS]|uniref:Uncharacterized protein n=1 Tax=Tigheibacillus jepli TaxID=3035914 RepID=A0ABU5CGR8_9BACI|nr:hypothetical protein [Virgibacillus sp. 179-BFC.A HS]MDY0404740.1 hypothetical protein [Virgibacillus sp. 179-BFC.A HS]